MITFTIVLTIVTIVLLLPSVSDLVSLGRRALGVRPPDVTTSSPLPALLFLVPAHNEEAVIESCLSSLLAMRYPADRMKVVVVADNCTDRTAQLARAFGAFCLEREDALRRGKPWAIAWAVERIPLRSYDALVIIDADSVVDPGFAAALAGAAPLAEKAVQAYNDVSNRTENALTRMAAVFSAVRYLFINRLKQQVGLNVPLGNGLCIGTQVMTMHGWKAFSIGEDWEMYAALTTQGVRIESVPDARVYSQEATSFQQSSSQRRRWTVGRLTVLATYSRAILRSRRVRLHQKLDALAELSAAGPVVHLGAVLLLIATTLALHPPGTLWIVLALGLTVARATLYTVAAVRVDPEPVRAAIAFAFLPIYMIWRLGVQLTAVATVGNTAWIRTGR